MQLLCSFRRTDIFFRCYETYSYVAKTKFKFDFVHGYSAPTANTFHSFALQRMQFVHKTYIARPRRLAYYVRTPEKHRSGGVGNKGAPSMTRDTAR